MFRERKEEGILMTLRAEQCKLKGELKTLQLDIPRNIGDDSVAGAE